MYPWGSLLPNSDKAVVLHLHGYWLRNYEAFKSAYAVFSGSVVTSAGDDTLRCWRLRE